MTPWKVLRNTMNKVIAISESPEGDSVLGLVVGEPFCEISIKSLSAIGFKEIKDFKLTTDNFVMKSDVFNPAMLNEFSHHSGLDYSFFHFFACRKENLLNMITHIDPMYEELKNDV
jgi:hypothetical protein